MAGAVHALDGEALDLGLPFAQELHLAVSNLIGPNARFADGQAAQRAVTRRAAAGHKLSLVSPVYVGHGQGAALEQGRGALIFGHTTTVTTRDNGPIIHAGHATAHRGRIGVHAVADGVLEADVAVEVGSGREDQLAVAQHHGAVFDEEALPLGNRLAIDRRDGEGVALGVEVVTQYVQGDGAILGHSKGVVDRLRRRIHHAVVTALGREIARGVGQGGIHGHRPGQRQAARGNRGGHLTRGDVLLGQELAEIGLSIAVPIHIQGVAALGTPRQADHDIDTMLALGV